MKFINAFFRDPALHDLFRLLSFLLIFVYAVAILIKFPLAGVMLIGLYMYFKRRRLG